MMTPRYPNDKVVNVGVLVLVVLGVLVLVI